MKCCVATHVKECDYQSKTHNFFRFQSSGGRFFCLFWALAVTRPGLRAPSSVRRTSKTSFDNPTAPGVPKRSPIPEVLKNLD